MVKCFSNVGHKKPISSIRLIDEIYLGKSWNSFAFLARKVHSALDAEQCDSKV